MLLGSLYVVWDNKKKNYMFDSFLELLIISSWAHPIDKFLIACYKIPLHSSFSVDWLKEQSRSFERQLVSNNHHSLELANFATYIEQHANCLNLAHLQPYIRSHVESSSKIIWWNINLSYVVHVLLHVELMTRGSCFCVFMALYIWLSTLLLFRYRDIAFSRDKSVEIFTRWC